MTQAELFEPRPADLPGLVGRHLTMARRHQKLRDVFNARGMQVLADAEEHAAQQHECQAEEIAMLAEFYALGGVVS